MKEKLATLFAKLKNRFRGQEETAVHPLKSLRPQKGIKGHESYANDLVAAVNNPEIFNIAITGSYGSGKSSILLDFREKIKNRVIQVSFSSLGANIQGYIKSAERDDHEKLNNLTNLIQKEIVKQILFKEKYKNIPYSKYKRVSSPRAAMVLFSSFVITFIIFAISVPNGWFKRLFTAYAVDGAGWQVAVSVDLFVTITCLLALIFLTLGAKVKIDKIGASSLSLSLSGNASYFDEYLDEIIYFFEAGKYDVVIFEDIDRFESLYIFENLRQLNTILNNSDQIGRQVTFIYAIKDSIFSKEVVDEAPESADKAKSKANHRERSTNRTKFFDQIIPVVPFITNISSQSYMLEAFDTEDRHLLKGPISVVAKHITDMRLVTNIYNEFLIFKEKVIVKDSGLSVDKLFAVVAYKNWNLEEFEKVKDGDSAIDKVIQAHSQHIDQRISEINLEIAKIEKTVKTINTIDERAKKLGTKLIEHIDAVLRQVGGTINAYSLNGTTYERDDFLGNAFWEDIIKAADSNTLITTFRANTGYTQTMTLNSADIKNITGDSLNKELWDKESLDVRNELIGRLRAEANKLPYMSIKELLDYSEKFRNELEELDGGRIADDPVGWQLILAGYIDTEFIHYTSLYHSAGMSLRARSFWLNNVRLNKQSFHHKFENEDDIEALLNEIGPTYLNDKSMYNISVVDYLLSNYEDKRVDNVIKNLANGGDVDIKFIDAYVKEGAEVAKLVELLATEWDGVYAYIVDSKDMDEKKKSHFISLALANSRENLKYKITPDFRNFVREKSKDIQVLTGQQDKDVVDNACRLLMDFGIIFKSFDGFSKVAQDAIKDYGLYDINETNLNFVLGEGKMPIDKIKQTDEYVYAHILGHLDDYIEIFKDSADSEFMLVGAEGFESVIDDISKISLDNLDSILAKADLSNCIVEDINKIDSKTWSTLIGNVIISNTLSNILTYFNLKHAEDKTIIDDELAEYLNTAETVVLDKDYKEYVEDEIKAFVLAVLNSDKITEKVKADIVKDCYPENYILITDIKKQEGLLYGYLLAQDCIEDSAASFVHIRDLSWATKAAYIANSSKFLEYIAELSLTSSELNSLTEDTSIPKNVKDYIVKNIVSYEAELSINSASRLASHALANGDILDAASLRVIVDGPSNDISIKLINLASASLTAADMLQILPVVGGEYRKLTQANKRPTFDNTDYNLSLIKRLKELGLVSSYEVREDKGRIKVTMKSRW